MLARKWREQYKNKNLPSSIRNKPSRAMHHLTEFLKTRNVDLHGNVVDLGCGNGRNAFYLASLGYHVTALDSDKTTIKKLNQNIAQQDAAASITTQCTNMGKKWPVMDEDITLAVDISSYHHLIESKQQDMYHRELCRTLKPGGYYMLNVIDVKDGYYSQFRDKKKSKNQITDPATNTALILYTRADIEQKFHDEFKLQFYRLRGGTNEMHGAIYTRQQHLFIFQKN